MNKFNFKKSIFLSFTLGCSIFSANMAHASGGVSCISTKSKLRFDIVESSERTPVSAKVFYKTNAIDGEDGSVHSLDLKNTNLKKPIIYSQENKLLLIIIYNGSSIISAKVDLENSNGKAAVMMANENKILNLNCTRE